MFDDNEKYIEKLGDIIRELADVWPNDREGVMVAGAKFEEIADELKETGVQLKKLMDLAWKGMIHLYEKDEFFISVKNATMHSVNTVREYLLNKGDMAVEDFERSCEIMEQALSGEGESADKVVDLDEIPNAEPGTEGETGVTAPQKTTYSLNALASEIINIEEGSTVEELNHIAAIAGAIDDSYDENVLNHIKEVKEIIHGIIEGKLKIDDNCLASISQKVEDAIQAEEDSNWRDTQNGSGQSGETEGINEALGDVPVDTEIEKADSEETEHFVIPLDIEVEMLGEFITECNDLIETAEVALLGLEESPDDEELVNTIFRAFHTIKGTSAFMGLDPVSDFTHHAETLLSKVRDGDMPFDKACADISLRSIDILKKLLQTVENATGGDLLPTPPAYDKIMRILHLICEEGISSADAIKQEGGGEEAEGFLTPSGGLEEAALEQKPKGGDSSAEMNNGVQQTGKKKQDEDSTVRVNVGRLDRLIDMVGELVIAHSVVAQDGNISKDSDLMKKLNHTTKIIRELQDASLTLRMVPLKAAFNRMNRLVRDLARKAGKQIKFSSVGSDTEIDRNMVDIISEPLVHLLRNAIDHGIEKPEERVASDKTPTANVWLRAYQEGGKVVIEIEDDGKGIDKEKILNKGIEKGLVDSDKKLSDNEIYNLIFLPGFSSVDEVTDLSGRGVGMDVVRRSIEQLQGKVDVKSQLGKGTKISLELPFTLAITDGMLVRIGDQRFIIPTINIDMTFRPEEHHLFTVMGSSEQVNFRGKSVPVIRLHKLFGINGSKENILESTLLVIDSNNKKFALLVDEVIGQQQLVGKSININVQMPHISGGAILGDGRVGLILDTSAIGKN